MKEAILKFYKITYPFAMLWMTYAVFFNSDLGWKFYAGMIAYVFFGLSMFDDVKGYRVDTEDNSYWDDEIESSPSFDSIDFYAAIDGVNIGSNSDYCDALS